MIYEHKCIRCGETVERTRSKGEFVCYNCKRLRHNSYSNKRYEEFVTVKCRVCHEPLTRRRNVKNARCLKCLSEHIAQYLLNRLSKK